LLSLACFATANMPASDNDSGGKPPQQGVFKSPVTIFHGDGTVDLGDFIFDIEQLFGTIGDLKDATDFTSIYYESAAPALPEAEDEEPPTPEHYMSKAALKRIALHWNANYTLAGQPIQQQAAPASPLGSPGTAATSGTPLLLLLLTLFIEETH
jgi:hypothetical protein